MICEQLGSSKSGSKLVSHSELSIGGHIEQTGHAVIFDA